jgi:hypothetical protein
MGNILNSCCEGAKDLGIDKVIVNLLGGEDDGTSSGLGGFIVKAINFLKVLFFFFFK